MRPYLRLLGYCVGGWLLVALIYTLVGAWPEAHQNGVAEGTLPMRILGWLEYWLFWIVLYSGPLFLMMAVALAVVSFMVAAPIMYLIRCWIKRQ